MMNTTLSTTFYLLLLLSLTTATSTHQQSDHPAKQTTENNPRLQKAYTALQALKNAITSDPHHFTQNWVGCDVCSYKGVYCAPALDNPAELTVAGVDLNKADITGTIPNEVGLLLTDLALIHINSNRFFGPIPDTFCHLQLLHELDLSNNMFCGSFPTVFLTLHNLKFLDIRYNHFEGEIPPAVFDLKLDALFLNNNAFTSFSTGSIGNSPVSVLVIANNNLNGCFPPGIAKMGATLEQVILLNAGLKGCLPANIGDLTNATVFDVSFNQLTGELPESMGDMKALEQLDIGYNKFMGAVPESICSLPNLQNFTYTHNFFCSEAPQCLHVEVHDDTYNCLPSRPLQRSAMECKSFHSHPPTCNSLGYCSPPPPPPVYYSPPPPPPPQYYTPHSTPVYHP